MKYLIAIIVLLGGISQTYAYNPATDVSSGARVDRTIKHPYYRESKGSYDLYMSSGVYLFALKSSIQPIWNASGTNARKLQSEHKFDLVTNAGYFTYHGASNSFQPAGRIVDGIRVIRSMVKEFFSKGLDKNLAVTLIYRNKSNTVELSHNDIVVPTTGIWARYTGPQIIQSGQILTDITANISHRQRKATRTFLIIDMNGKPHLGVTIEGYTLPALAAKIQEMKVFYGKYHVVNMDGGSSTALAAGTRYWNSRSRLPWFFGVK